MLSNNCNNYKPGLKLSGTNLMILSSCYVSLLVAAICSQNIASAGKVNDHEISSTWERQDVPTHEPPGWLAGCLSGRICLSRSLIFFHVYIRCHISSICLTCISTNWAPIMVPEYPTNALVSNMKSSHSEVGRIY